MSTAVQKVHELRASRVADGVAGPSTHQELHSMNTARAHGDLVLRHIRGLMQPDMLADMQAESRESRRDSKRKLKKEKSSPKTHGSRMLFPSSKRDHSDHSRGSGGSGSAAAAS